MDNLEELYIPWHNHKQSAKQLSQNVWYLGYFVGFGEVYARHTLWKWDKTQTPQSQRGKALVRSQVFQERALDAALADLKDCVILSTTPSYFSQFQNACLLKSRGFQVLGNRCYKHPGYPGLSDYSPEHPGIPDRYQHWEHIWYKVVGDAKEIGAPSANKDTPNNCYAGVNNCGIDAVNGPEAIKAHDSGSRKKYLAVGWLARGTPFPKGWKRFFSASDYKLGVNFDTAGLANVEKCQHNFDLKIFEGWKPNFDKWRPA